MLALQKEGIATANQHRVGPDPLLVDQTQRGRLGGKSRATNRDIALPRARFIGISRAEAKTPRAIAGFGLLPAKESDHRISRL